VSEWVKINTRSSSDGAARQLPGPDPPGRPGGRERVGHHVDAGEE